MKPDRQQLHDFAEREPGVGPPVQKHDHLTVSVAVLCVVQPWAGCELGSGEAHRHHQRVESAVIEYQPAEAV
jgi:hypothetical protein